MKYDSQFFCTFYSDLGDQLADNAVFEVLHIRTGCGYLLEESVESAFYVEGWTDLCFLPLDDLAKLGDVSVDSLEFAFKFLL